MQKKKGDIAGFSMLVLITDTAIKAPIKYEPLSPKKILAFGKLYLTKTAIIKIPLSKKKS